MNEILAFTKKKWELWRDNPVDYQKYLVRLEREIGFSGKFIPYAPTCFQGDWTKLRGKILIISYNPSTGLKNEYSKWEERVRGFKCSEEERRGLFWEDQETFMKNYFQIMKKKNLSLYFFTRIGNILSRLDSKYRLGKDKLYMYLQTKIINVDLLPFYSEKFKLRKVKNLSGLEEFWERIIGFIQLSEISSFWVNGLDYRHFLKNHGSLCGEAGRGKGSMYPIRKISLGTKQGVLTCFSNQINYGVEPLLECIRETVQYNGN